MNNNQQLATRIICQGKELIEKFGSRTADRITASYV